MNWCGSNELEYSVLSMFYSNLSLYEMRNEWEGIVKSSSAAFNATLYFDPEGKIIESGENNNYSFKVSENAVLKQITISKRASDMKIWRSISSQPEEVRKDDIIKLGTTTISVFDIYPISEHNAGHKEQRKVIENEKEYCRICFSNEQSREDPLLNFCKCSGSVKFMHLQCYREWFIQKVRIFKQNKITYFQFHNVRCDLCKQTMPFTTVKQGRTYTILDYKKTYDSVAYSDFDQFEDELLDEQSRIELPVIREARSEESSFDRDQPLHLRQNSSNSSSSVINTTDKYIVLKSQKMNAEHETTVEVIVVKLINKEMILFGSDLSRCHILMSSGSASQVHAGIYLDDGRIWLKDANSHTGTFMQFRQNQSVSFQSKKGVLIEHSNRQLLYIRAKPSFIPCLTISTEYRILVESCKETDK